MPDIISPASARSRFDFQSYRKLGYTEISDEVVPAGTTFETANGPIVVDFDARVAFDSAGQVYPIRNDVFDVSYESLPQDGADPDACDRDCELPSQDEGHPRPTYVVHIHNYFAASDDPG